MLENEKISDKDRIRLVRDIYNKALAEINIIKKDRDRRIAELLQTIDARHIAKTLQDIKDLK